MRRTAETAAVVKADAYGLGMEQVAPVLRRAGCRTFFVAHVDEGVVLRGLLGSGPAVVVLHGPPPGTERLFHEHGLIPVLNSLEQIAGWQGAVAGRDSGPVAFLHIDTGMSRLGLSASDVETLTGDADRLRGVRIGLVMSHLACADRPDDPANPAQLADFNRLRARLPAAPASLAASSGIFLGPEYHLDLVRPGAALYGVAPNESGPNPMAPVVRLQGCVVQSRTIPPGTGVGYGATFRAATQRRIATVAVGYADGFLRGFSNRGAVWLGRARLPIVGRVSMDSLTVDVTDHEGPPILPGTLGRSDRAGQSARRSGAGGRDDRLRAADQPRPPLRAPLRRRVAAARACSQGLPPGPTPRLRCGPARRRAWFPSASPCGR